jgi:hypothetical protein
MSVVDELRELFFGEENIQRTIYYILKDGLQKSDIIVLLATVAVETPLCVAFTEHGLVPFRSVYNFVVSYQHMTPKQLEFCMSQIRSMRRGACETFQNKMTHSSYVSVISKSKQRIFIDMRYLLASIISMINNSKFTSIKSHDVSNLIVQQISNSVSIPRETLIAAFKLAKRQK